MSVSSSLDLIRGAAPATAANSADLGTLPRRESAGATRTACKRVKTGAARPARADNAGLRQALALLFAGLAEDTTKAPGTPEAPRLRARIGHLRLAHGSVANGWQSHARVPPPANASPRGGAPHGRAAVNS